MTHVSVDVRTGEETIISGGDEIALAEWRANVSVSPAQMRIALHRMGELDAVQAIVDADKEASIIWEYATRIDRNSPLIAALSSGHYTQSEIDGMFAAAAQVTI